MWLKLNHVSKMGPRWYQQSNQFCALTSPWWAEGQLENVPAAWASYQIRKIAGCACAGNAGNVFPCRRFQIKPLVSDPGMHHGTCVTHVPWCMSGSLTCGDRENVPGIPGACAPAILRIWQEAHYKREPFCICYIPWNVQTQNMNGVKKLAPLLQVIRW